jgi:BirA family biotin operon repressor/biotin-[acetyl-CoA-carboxylase] ligase
MCSVVVRPGWDPERIGLVSLAAGVAMAEAASEVSSLDVRCKWPNDLLVADAKVGGILAESEIAEDRVRHVVIGVGVNLEAPEAVPGAGAIGGVDEEELLSAYLIRFRGTLEGPSSEILDRWRAVSATVGRRVEATTVDGDVVRGIAADVDDTGALLLDSATGLVRIAFGAVTHLDVDRG